MSAGVKVHIRVQQRTGRKYTTVVEGLDDDLDLKRICKAMKKKFNCDGTVKVDEKTGAEVIILHGDQRENAEVWLYEQEIYKRSEERIVVHGF